MLIKFIKKTEKWFENETVDLPENEAKAAIEAKEAEEVKPEVSDNKKAKK